MVYVLFRMNHRWFVVWLYTFFPPLIPSVTWWPSRLQFELGLFNFVLHKQTGGNVEKGVEERFVAQTPTGCLCLLLQYIGLVSEF